MRPIAYAVNKRGLFYRLEGQVLFCALKQKARPDPAAMRLRQKARPDPTTQ